MPDSLTTTAMPVHPDTVSGFETLSIPHSVLSQIPYTVAIEYFVMPYGVDSKGRIEVLMAYPHDCETIQNIQLHCGACIKPQPIAKETLLKLISKHYGALASSPKQGDLPHEIKSSRRMSMNHGDTTLVLVDDVIHEAVRLRASDIHMEPFEREMCVRFRVDGVLQEMLTIPKERVAQVTSRLKIMAGMDIAEKRRPQDGRIRINGKGRDVDIRVSSLPTDFGEKIVLRILDKSGFDYSLENIGMDPKRLALFKKAVQMPNGIVMLTGPTGSGKTTTLYGVMNFLKKPGVNISTVEDPIEYNIIGVNQTQVNALTNMTFANSLRTLLRQDPDIIMVGEMRDQETAEIAVRASLTGHLVLSTLHTNDSPSAITRLVDMGVEPYLVASSVTMIVAQRLVRRICDHCKCEDTVPDSIKESIGLARDVKIYKGLGCSACGRTGYKGRTGVYEVLAISEPIRKLIKDKAYASEIRNQAISEGLVSLRDNAIVALREGTTSLEEVLREISVLT
jgi:type IV pilus assembly protein PilB